MASTIGANGLSIVHKGSGGEANASVPDVCLTKVGKPVVPIPYGNNAKSADLVDGSTSVTADGGNSIALQGSKFSKSTGDAAGDKKGVSSGTIEGEAQFVTSSPNVLIEGKGVARQSDQMTMNNGNTMCFGVQNPSFSVEEDLEETFIMDVCVRHPNGQRLVNAPFKLSDEQGSTVYEATLDEKGRSDADPLKGGKVKLLVEESQDPFVVAPIRRENPRHVDSQSDDDFFNIASKGQRGFWQPTRIETVGTAWGSIGQTLSSDRYFQDMVSAEVIQHFTHYHPDTTFDVSKTCDALIGNLDQPLPHTAESLLAYTLPQVLEEGELLSVLLRLAPHETTDRMLAYMRARGKGNPQAYLADYDWQAAQKSINSELDALLNKLKSRLTFLRDEASKLQYAYLSEDVFDKHIDTLSSYMKLLPDLISGVFSKMQTKASELLANTDNVKVIKAADDLHSIESESIEAVVNTTKTIDTVEPFMNEVAGVIENVIPIYPVRYGYANFFDELMPAQAPPSMLEMSGATGLKDTGGYLLRLLREGWLYIKEESEEETAPFHIFKYAQTETATGVIEKFEKYYFTNEENAQEGLTLDTSSGSTFYPFAFVTPKAKKISIVYSEHEWSAAIIDNMNNDEELRKKAMQQVDLTAQQTEFSQAATQDNLSALVEDYRNNDEKWLADKDSAKPMPHGLDLATTTLSYHLDAEGIVETMQKSHSEHKDGALVVLFDPVGRQRDLSKVISKNVAEQQAYVNVNKYPLTIGQYAQSCLESDIPEVKKAAEENLELGALEKFFTGYEEKTIAQRNQRKKLLTIMDYFVAGKGAEDEVGSLTCYLRHYFDIRQQGIIDPAAEMGKLLLLLGSLFEGVTASEEGIENMDRWVGEAFHTEELTPLDKVWGVSLKAIQIVFLQPQEQINWHHAVPPVLTSIGNYLARIQAEFTYGTKLLGNSGLECFYRATLPSLFDALLGVRFTGNRLNMALDDIENVIDKQTGQKSSIKSNVHFGEKLLNWSEMKANQSEQRIFELLEAEPTASAPEWLKRLADKLPTKTLLHFAQESAGLGLTYWSYQANVNTINDLLAQTQFDTLDPVNDDKEYAYRTVKMLSTLAAITADSITLSQYSAKGVNIAAREAERALLALQKQLPNMSKQLAEKLGVRSLQAYSQRLDTRLTAAPIKGLVVGANVALAFTYFWDAFTSDRAGNDRARLGYVVGGVSSVLIAFSVIGGPAGVILFAVGLTGLLFSAHQIDRFGKNSFENLLYSSFWGASEYYPFWSDFKKQEDIDTVQERIDVITAVASNNNKAVTSDNIKYFDAALNIESQEFLNYFYAPKLTIVDSSIRPYGSEPYRYKLSYVFVLPDFKMNVSQLHGSIYRELDDAKYAAYSVPEPDKAMTETFRSALAAAFEDRTLCIAKEDGLHVTVNVEFSHPARLIWCYEPTPNTVVPKRYLTNSGYISTSQIGMLDEKPNTTPWGK
ncbi:PAAR-like domain-containing protein [Vibrio parahaemolyticus]|uniref:PAAR-like domain-containing protein n=1 Tax=Vibrio parahaemolyticus TaxID=670 RepID=UPI002556B345|nr:PAAR-like domain-containing protein [Vibrio parahaemolyticus]